MPTIQRKAAGVSGFAAWRMVVWLLLLLAAFGCVQYVTHAQRVWDALQSLPPGAEGASNLHVALAWDIGYLVAAFAVIVVCAGAILRQAWSRPALQVTAVLLALWALVSGATLLMQWQEFHQTVTAAQAAGDTGVFQLPLDRMQRNMQMAVAFKAVCVVAMLWLAWRLAQPSVRAQFRERPKRR